MKKSILGGSGIDPKTGLPYAQKLSSGNGTGITPINLSMPGTDHQPMDNNTGLPPQQSNPVELFNENDLAIANKITPITTAMPGITKLASRLPSASGMAENLAGKVVNAVAPLDVRMPNVMTEGDTTVAREIPQMIQGEISYQQAYSIGDELARDDGSYYENVLNQYENCTYHFKFLMASDSDVMAALQSGTDPTSAYDQMSKVILAESGVTAGVAIRDVRFTTIATLKRDQDVGNNKYTINLFEAGGVSLLDGIRKAAIKLRIKNPQNCPYFLELTFPGYDENGERYGNVLENHPDFPNGGRWIFMVNISMISTNFDTNGTEYSISAVPFSASREGDEFTSIQDMMSIKGSTIGEMLDDLGEQLKLNQINRYFVNMREFDFVAHEIPGFEGEDPKTFPVSLREVDLADQSIYTVDDKNIPTIQISRGSVTDAIELIYSICPKVQQLAKGVDAIDELDSPASRMRKSIVFNIEPRTLYTGHERYSGQYTGKTTYYIHAYETDEATLTRKQVDNAKAPEVQSEIVRNWREKGLLRKRYDYLHTGKNTEVINFDAKFNFNWAAVLPQTYGMNTSIEQIAQYARYNDATAENRTYQERAAKLRNEIAIMDHERGALERQEQEAIANNDQDARLKVYEKLTENANARTSKFDELSNLASSFRNNLPGTEEMSFETTVSEGSTIYLDELGDMTDGDRLFEINFTQKSIAGTKGGANPYYRDRGIYGTILEQIYTSDFNTVTIEIRGDPYWLGSDDLERYRLNSSNGGRRDTLGTVDNYTAANYLLFNMRFPYTMDEEGAPVFRSTDDGDMKDGFTGFYTLTTVENIFEGGQFRQTINAVRFTLVSMMNAMGLTVEGQDTIVASDAPQGSRGAATGGVAGVPKTGNVNQDHRNTLPGASDEDLIIRTVYGECRNCTAEEQRSIANVIINRAKLKNQSIREVVFKNKQFSPWNLEPGMTGQVDRLVNLDPNSSSYQSIRNNIAGAIDGSIPDATQGATHFYVGATPYWAKGVQNIPTPPGYKHTFQNQGTRFP